MADVTGKVVKIQLTIEYTKTDGLQATKLNPKVVTIQGDALNNVGALILDKECMEKTDKTDMVSVLEQGLNEKYTVNVDQAVGTDGTENAVNTFAVVENTGAVTFACGPGSHPPAWEVQ